VRLSRPGVVAVTRVEAALAIERAITRSTLYDCAAAVPSRRAYQGRAAAFGVSLAELGGAGHGAAGDRVVVRHNRHGGLLRALTGDRFLPPTRAPYELHVSHRLRECGVDTPDVVAYAVYQAGFALRRSDVVVREVADAADLATPVHDPAVARAAVEALLDALARAGAAHADLNARNILLVAGPPPTAWVLDVDRVRFHAPGTASVARDNRARLARSARKLGIRWLL